MCRYTIRIFFCDHLKLLYTCLISAIKLFKKSFNNPSALCFILLLTIARLLLISQARFLQVLLSRTNNRTYNKMCPTLCSRATTRLSRITNSFGFTRKCFMSFKEDFMLFLRKPDFWLISEKFQFSRCPAN